MIGRLVHTADFQRLLTTSPRSRSAHFAMHYVMDGPLVSKYEVSGSAQDELSTAEARRENAPVDNIAGLHWLGSVIPKRHARRAVTRSLLKRQIRGIMSQHLGSLAPGLWLVRLRSPFAKAQFISAASPALLDAARQELHLLFAHAAA